MVGFTVASAGTVKVWGRVLTPTDKEDSYWVRVDGGAWTQWNNIPLGSSWHWDDVHDSTASDAAVSYDLAARPHTVTFAYREDGTQLDRVVITSDPTLVPTD
jgi:hypothetical protein